MSRKRHAGSSSTFSPSPSSIAVVLPDIVLFEGCAGENTLRDLLKQSYMHTLPRLPTDNLAALGFEPINTRG